MGIVLLEQATRSSLATVGGFGVAVIGLTWLWLWWWRRRHRDEFWQGITPGTFPPPNAPEPPVGRLTRGSNWGRPVAVQFQPPKGLSAGQAGTVIDNTANTVDVSATLIELAVRGFFSLRPLRDPMPVGPADKRHVGKKRKEPEPDRPRDWELVQSRPEDPAAEAKLQDRFAQLSPVQQLLLRNLFAHGPVARLSELKQRNLAQTFRDAQQGLYDEVVRHGWYRRHPRRRGRGPRWVAVLFALLGGFFILGGLVNAGRDVGDDRILDYALAGVGGAFVVAAVMLWIWGRVWEPRTAAGSAVRIQTEGFRQYIATAEAGQIRFEEASNIFSRYLPFAMVFGLTDRWAGVFGEVAKMAQMQGIDATFDLVWLDTAFDLAYLGFAVGDLIELADLGEVLGGLASGLGDFSSSVSDTLDLGDGCDVLDGCDGCDGCDIF